MQTIRATRIAQEIDLFVAELLAIAGIEKPPVDAFRVAKGCNIVVAWDRNQPERARMVRLGWGSRCRNSVFLRPDRRPERLQWAVAHEVGETMAAQLFARLDGLVDRAEAAERERLANAVATRLLLPERWFLQDARECDWDITLLKDRYHTASFELVARRMLEFARPAVITIFDQGRVTFRRGCIAQPSRTLPVELNCWAEVHRAGEPRELFDGSLRVRGWAIHEPGWKREILRTEPAESARDVWHVE